MSDQNALAFKGPKRKRLAKACDACHKSKRRCDGTGIFPPRHFVFVFADSCVQRPAATDAAGRPVPAPCAASSAAPQATSAPARRVASSAGSSSSRSGRTRRPAHADFPLSTDARKRPRVDDSAPILLDPVSASHPDPPPTSAAHAASPARVSLPDAEAGGLRATLDPHVVRDLVSLFFAHLYPMRLILHMPSFLADLTSGRVPAHLVHAVCAIAAPLYPGRPRGSAPRSAGMHHAAAARELLFDSHGVLRVPRDLVAVQTLCLLQNHEHVASFPWAVSLECFGWFLAFPFLRDRFDLATRILRDDLRIHDPGGHLPDALSYECTRRCAWYIRFIYINHFAFHSVPIPPPEPDCGVPLPADEASFDMLVLSQVPHEYMQQPAPQSPRQSEFGHVLRISECLYAISVALDKAKAAENPHTPSSLENVAGDIELRIAAWEASLSPAMQYTDENSCAHRLLYDTAANSAAWCFFTAHVMHACAALGFACDVPVSSFGSARRLLGLPTLKDVSWARPRISKIMASLGRSASYNVLAAIGVYFPPLPLGPGGWTSTSSSPPDSAHEGSPVPAPLSAPAPSAAGSSYFRSLGNQFARMRGGSPAAGTGSINRTESAHHALALVDAPADLYASQVMSNSTAMRRLRLESASGSSRGGGSDAQSISGQSLPSLKESGLLDCEGSSLPAPPVLGLARGAPRNLPWLADGRPTSVASDLRGAGGWEMVERDAEGRI
ncbi:hypothetical protein K488DRAFT_73377 [Vararia minispora EC-137]|uniref:Uncharacterized protein n=1 Tax=Vararia minispora EC-137 TaxID=1314806 RepID=A0ACB8QBA1_9AGAM|nr:hypothetical protein K488DRAFT_73377 [Vararia minispora EC-137]